MKNTGICSAIVNINNCFAIGLKGNSLYHIPNDIKHFKELTYNKYVIVGRKTYELIPNGLPNRKVILLTHNKNYECRNDNVKIVNSIEKTFEILSNTSEKEFFVIGGGQIYEQFSRYFSKIYITHVDNSQNGDVFFNLNLDEYECISISKKKYKDTKYSFEEYIKKKTIKN